MKLEYSRQIFGKSRTSNFVKLQREPRFFMRTDGQTDRQTLRS